jgi:UDP-glucose 4-epimerase
VNCAGSASVPQSFEDPFKDYELNTRIVFSILTAIKEKNPACKFINLSSAAVYGNPQLLPVSETAPVKPISPYGNHKYMSELICNQFHDFFGLQTCSLRIFSAYGVGLKKQIFWELFQKTKQGKPIKLFGSGDESRDFIYITDLVEVIEMIGSLEVFEHRVINVANGVEIKIRDLVRSFFSAFGGNITFEFTGNEKTGDPKCWQADISRIRKMGYAPKVSLEEGIRGYISWVKSLKP